MSTFQINIDRQIIKLLGAQLYGDTPSVINELIANSHDARAKRVWITIKTTAPYSIIIEDDGIGMTVDEINKYYLNIGYNRREEESLREIIESTGDDRPDMGQKGIGKLAVFSLSKIVNLISVKNGHAVGCKMDFDVITRNDGNPEELDVSDFKTDKLSENGSGTRIELTNVVKNLNKSFRFIASSITRSFVMNDGLMRIFLRKDDEQFKEIKRSELNYFDDMDTIVTIGGYTEYSDAVKVNSIPEKYKFISNYNEILNASNQSRKGKLDALPIALKVFDKNKEHEKDFEFKFNGWIGTVRNTDSFKKILERDGYNEEDTLNRDTIVIDDNRVTIYSRGKVGEYNILPKLQTRAQNDAYIIGEIFVDDFENDDFIDMATSNRRGYQDDDPRYEALCRNLKIIVKKLVNEKEKLSNARKKDENLEKAKKIEDEFSAGQIKSKSVIQDKLTDDDRELLTEDFKQFSRALSLSQSTKKIFISHKEDCKEFGRFIIEVLIKINPGLQNSIIFTSLPEYGVPHGKDIFDYLKDCFREDLFVIFLFSRSFYDSNVCISEAGAAWSTNKKYSNIVIDMGFNDISKPINNAQSSASFKFATEDDKTQFAHELKYILNEVDKTKAYDVTEIIGAIDSVLGDNPIPDTPQYYPKRKFQVTPICSACGNKMHIEDNSGILEYKCTCGETMKGEIYDA